MLPLSVLCAVYSTYLSTASDEDILRFQRPLTLAQLHGQGAGLLDLLKYALWQVRDLPPALRLCAALQLQRTLNLHQRGLREMAAPLA